MNKQKQQPQKGQEPLKKKPSHQGKQPLAAYLAKRTFEKTSEPAARASSSSNLHELGFVVQRHAASHLHYDFRIELDGVLKSWAVPKGPSLDAGVKRLAMEVEDHPLDYANFEGTIPEGNYGAGEVRIWDRGVYRSSKAGEGGPEENLRSLREGLAKGHIDILLYGDKLKGLFSLVRIKKDAKGKNAWLLIKQKDTYARSDEPDPMPTKVRPMLAALVSEPFNRSGWIFEIKWDGYRAIAEIEDGNVKLYSRNGLSFVAKYPSIVEALRHVEQNVVLDGEIVAIKNGRPDFQALQNFEETSAVLQYVVFDILFAEGRDLRQKTLRERKDILKSILPRQSAIVFNEHVEDLGIPYFNELKKLGLEGMVAKDAESTYAEGRRNGSWLKIKIHNQQEAIVCGFTAPRGSRKKLGALILGAYENGSLKYLGHSGGGFTEKELDSLYEKLKKIEVPNSPFSEKLPTGMPITWVKPEVVCEIKYSEWTSDGRMRHPIFVGLRPDKNPEEVVKENSLQIEEASESAGKTQQKMPSPGAVGLSVSKSASPPTTAAQKFSNLDKIFWPEDGYTKGDLIGYYDSIAEYILPHLKDRPESLNRHPNGINGKNFFQKDNTIPVPDFVQTEIIYSDTNDKNIRYILCQNRETLLYMANLGCIELNPWLSRIGNLDRPDFIVIDLDPGESPFKGLIPIAQVVRQVLTSAGITSFCKTSGKSGLHIMLPMGGIYDYDQAKNFAELIARLVHRQMPDRTSLERTPSKRGNKVYVDYLQNRQGQTIAAPYSVRPCSGATVSTPLEWEEVTEDLNPKAFTIKNTRQRLDKVGDLWKPTLTQRLDIEKALKSLERV